MLVKRARLVVLSRPQRRRGAIEFRASMASSNHCQGIRLMGGERGVTARTTKLLRGTIGGCWDALPPCRGEPQPRVAAGCGECPTLRSPNRLSDCSATAGPRAVRRRNSLCYTELVLSRCSFLCCTACAEHPTHFRSEGLGHTGENTHTTGCAAAAAVTAHTRRHSA